MTKGWYRLLDTIASNEQPIDYFIETFLPPKVLEDAEFVHVSGENTFNIPADQFVMMYIPNKHIQCFTKDKSRCFTKHIRYHLSDIRYSEKYFQQANVASKFQGCYEQQLINKLIECVFEWSSIGHKESKIGDVLASSIFDEIVNNNLNKAYQILFALQDEFYQQTSIILKQVLKQKTTYEYTKPFLEASDTSSINYKHPLIIRWYEFLQSYCQLHVQLLIKDQTFVYLATQCKRIYSEYESHKDAYVIAIQESLEPSRIWFQFRKDNLKYVQDFITQLFRPVIELYFLLRSWKVTQTPKSWLNVWNAGYEHTGNVALILQQLGYYQVKEWKDTLPPGISAKSKNFSLTVQQQIDLKNIPATRCISFDNVSIKMSDYNCFFAPNNIAKQRIFLLGSSLYFQVLNGKKLTQQDIEVIISNKKVSQNKFRKMINKLFSVE